MNFSHEAKGVGFVLGQPVISGKPVVLNIAINQYCVEFTYNLPTFRWRSFVIMWWLYMLFFLTYSSRHLVWHVELAWMQSSRNDFKWYSRCLLRCGPVMKCSLMRIGRGTCEFTWGGSIFYSFILIYIKSRLDASLDSVRSVGLRVSRKSRQTPGNLMGFWKPPQTIAATENYFKNGFSAWSYVEIHYLLSKIE